MISSNINCFRILWEKFRAMSGSVGIRNAHFSIFQFFWTNNIISKPYCSVLTILFDIFNSRIGRQSCLHVKAIVCSAICCHCMPWTQFRQFTSISLVTVKFKNCFVKMNVSRANLWRRRFVQHKLMTSEILKE